MIFHDAVVPDRARGLVLGLLLGDAWPEGGARATCLGQLTCFTLEGLIRARVRAAELDVCHPPSVVWHAWRRWFALQGIAGPGGRAWPPGETWPDGWLSEVPVLRERRGSAPATVAALRSSDRAPDRAAGRSAGHHAVSRSLVAGLFAPSVDVGHLARGVAALSHGHPEAAYAAGVGAELAAALLTAPDAISADAAVESAASTAIRWALADAPRTAPHALLHGMLALASDKDLDDVLEVAAPHGPGAVTVAAALFGARHGVHALPTGDLGRLDLAWVGDVLAQDALACQDGAALGRRLHRDRYPGW